MTATPPTPPGLRRRLACAVYEGVVLFGVVMVVGLTYSVLTEQRHALQGQLGMQATVFAALGVYFGWFWSQGRQTVAMKTWQLHVTLPDGAPVGRGRALARYLASWLWCLPGLGVVALAGERSGGATSVALLANVGALALLARLHPARQALPDLLCGTQLVRRVPPPA